MLALPAARPLLERTLAISEKALGPEHRATAESLDNLGALLQAQGDLAAARPLFERALAIFEKALGPEHPYTNHASRRNLARLLLATKIGQKSYYSRPETGSTAMSGLRWDKASREVSRRGDGIRRAII